MAIWVLTVRQDGSSWSITPGGAFRPQVQAAVDAGLGPGVYAVVPDGAGLVITKTADAPPEPVAANAPVFEVVQDTPTTTLVVPAEVQPGG